MQPPPTNDAAELRRKFLTGASAPERTSASTQRRQRTRQRDGAELRRIHPWVRVEVERALARYCVEYECDAGGIVDTALAKFLCID